MKPVIVRYKGKRATVVLGEASPPAESKPEPVVPAFDPRTEREPFLLAKLARLKARLEPLEYGSRNRHTIKVAIARTRRALRALDESKGGR